MGAVRLPNILVLTLHDFVSAQVTQAQRMLLKGEKPGGPTNKGPYRLNLYLRNPHFLAAPFALRGPKTPVWNPNLQKLMLVMRCVEVRRLPLGIRTRIATCYPFVPSRGPFKSYQD